MRWKFFQRDFFDLVVLVLTMANFMLRVCTLIVTNSCISFVLVLIMMVLFVYLILILLCGPVICLSVLALISVKSACIVYFCFGSGRVLVGLCLVRSVTYLN